MHPQVHTPHELVMIPKIVNYLGEAACPLISLPLYQLREVKEVDSETGMKSNLLLCNLSHPTLLHTTAPMSYSQEYLLAAATHTTPLPCLYTYLHITASSVTPTAVPKLSAACHYTFVMVLHTPPLPHYHTPFLQYYQLCRDRGGYVLWCVRQWCCV